MFFNDIHKDILRFIENMFFLVHSLPVFYHFQPKSPLRRILSSPLKSLHNKSEPSYDSFTNSTTVEKSGAKKQEVKEKGGLNYLLSGMISDVLQSFQKEKKKEKA